MMRKTFPNETPNLQFGVNTYTSKQAEFYLNVIEELTDLWKGLIANNGEYLLQQKCNYTLY